MTRRYFVPDLPLAGGTIALPESELRHAVQVMRVQPGDALTLFDGKGHESEATVAEVGKRVCVCQALAAQTISRECSCRIHLGIALPKPDRSRELIERLTELGVSVVTPVVAEYSQRGPSPGMLEKLARGVEEASKQCGRNQMLEIGAPSKAIDFFRETSEIDCDKWLLQPAGAKYDRRLESIPEAMIAAIGPEGGWSGQEVEVATDSGYRSIGLGQRIYRIETAAAVIAALLAD